MLEKTLERIVQLIGYFLGFSPQTLYDVIAIKRYISVPSGTDGTRVKKSVLYRKIRYSWQACYSVCVWGGGGEGTGTVPTAQGKWLKTIPVRENTGNLKILPKHGEFGLLKLYIP